MGHDTSLLCRPSGTFSYYLRISSAHLPEAQWRANARAFFLVPTFYVGMQKGRSASDDFMAQSAIACVPTQERGTRERLLLFT